MKWKVEQSHVIYMTISQALLLLFLTSDIKISYQVKKPKLLLVPEEELFKRIDDFRFGKRVHSGAAAIRRLLNGALHEYEKKAKR